jgi:hypothetical protein
MKKMSELSEQQQKQAKMLVGAAVLLALFAIVWMVFA